MVPSAQNVTRFALNKSILHCFIKILELYIPTGKWRELWFYMCNNTVSFHHYVNLHIIPNKLIYHFSNGIIYVTLPSDCI